MKIKADKTLNFYAPNRHSFQITPAMGVVSHFPRYVCEALIEKGAVEVKGSPKKGKAESAK